MFRPVVHMLLHVIVPGVVARFGGRRLCGHRDWKYVWFVLSATILVDLDHLLAVPVYAPDRCSIGFHPLHSYWATAGYALLLCFPKTRLVGLGLLIHMLLDGVDCIWMKLE